MSETLTNDRGEVLRPVRLALKGQEVMGVTFSPGADGVAASVMVDNTDTAPANIAASMKRALRDFQTGLCPHDGEIAIVGSGPSVADHVEEIREHKARGRPVMAIKGAHDWLIERGITPDLWVCMDSQEKIVSGIQKKSADVCYLVASKCAPNVFDWLADQQVVRWNAFMGFEDSTFNNGELLVGGGSTSGLRGITLAWLMGFRRVTLYGFDSCMRDGVLRANGEKPTQWTRTIQAGVTGPSRHVDAPMLNQAAEFQAMTFEVMADLKVRVVGDGLLADIMAERKRLGFIDW